MIGPAMADRSPARILAPLALIASLAAVGIVVATSHHGDSTQARSTVPPRAHHARPAKPRPRVYVVKPGDNLTVIATRTGVDLGRLQQLNPRIDPQALHPGQRLKLVP
jgi:LysM repeat protein